MQLPKSVCGFRIIEDCNMQPSVPKLKLSKDFKYCSVDFRIEFDNWLYEKFGGTERLFLQTQNAIITHPSNVAALVKAYAAQNN